MHNILVEVMISSVFLKNMLFNGIRHSMIINNGHHVRKARLTALASSYSLINNLLNFGIPTRGHAIFGGGHIHLCDLCCLDIFLGFEL